MDDLLGLGIMLRPEQVALLEADEGDVLVPFVVPDPWSMHEQWGTKLAYDEAGRIEVITIPSRLHFCGTGHPDYAGDLKVIAANGSEPTTYPFLIGYSHNPFDIGYGDPVLHYIWDCWPVDPGILKELETAASICIPDLWWDLSEWGEIWNGNSECCDNVYDDRHSFDDCPNVAKLEAKIYDVHGNQKVTARDLIPDLSGLSFPARMAWQSCVQSSRAGWFTLRSIFPELESYNSQEGALSPWF